MQRALSQCASSAGCAGTCGLQLTLHRHSFSWAFSSSTPAWRGIPGSEPLIQRTAMQVLSATAQVLLLQNVITTNGLKSIPAQVHFQPGIQQDHVFDAGKHPSGFALILAICKIAACLSAVCQVCMQPKQSSRPARRHTKVEEPAGLAVALIIRVISPIV